MSQSPQGKPPTSTLAVVGLVLTCLCLQPFAFIVSFIALIRILSSKGRLGGLVLAIVALCLTVPLCGVQAAIAVPNFVKFQCRSKQSEARATLRSLFAAEESFKADHNAYSTDPAAVGFSPIASRYQFRILEAGPATFRAEAAGIGDMAGDRWEIDQTGEAKNLEGKCQ